MEDKGSDRTSDRTSDIFIGEAFLVPTFSFLLSSVGRCPNYILTRITSANIVVFQTFLSTTRNLKKIILISICYILNFAQERNGDYSRKHQKFKYWHVWDVRVLLNNSSWQFGLNIQTHHLQGVTVTVLQ